MKNMNNKFSFKNRIVLVTGGSKGIGRSICLEFLNLGATVFFTYRKNDTTYKSLKNLGLKYKDKIKGLKCDSSNIQNLKKLSKEIKKNSNHIDILINNVGDAFARSKFINSDDNLWQKNINLNLMSAVRTTKLFLNMLKKSKKPCIINMGSIAGKTTGSGDSLHYDQKENAC